MYLEQAKGLLRRQVLTTRLPEKTMDFFVRILIKPSGPRMMHCKVLMQQLWQNRNTEQRTSTAANQARQKAASRKPISAASRGAARERRQRMRPNSLRHQEASISILPLRRHQDSRFRNHFLRRRRTLFASAPTSSWCWQPPPRRTVPPVPAFGKSVPPPTTPTRKTSGQARKDGREAAPGTRRWCGSATSCRCCQRRDCERTARRRES
mmetsp:Transcript_18064/g.45243  ORF Transcript_18064/g.45243 Transcript_18064/m.45243 type:complete len:209 (+) Transcript_18064:3602-4228(+)